MICEDAGEGGVAGENVEPQQGAVTRLGEIRDRMGRAEADAGREPGSVTLVCVSKTFDAEVIRPVIVAGQRVFGENRVQEALGKWPALRAETPGIELHLIGPLQSNKAREAVQFFDVIETVDRDKIAVALAKEIAAVGRAPKLYVQVNTGAEPQKAGILPEQADDFIAYCRNDLKLDVSGLMCIPPVEEQAAPHFALLNKIAARNGIKILSMGMSGDFEIAIELGATHVRVGSAIFGAR
ncbi:YggS family pyridoxal phosphate-dependent enzyme [Methylovirgula ligni]|nr:YggS family pyridoxal phosphate-dependent enzyme [Methylovirgula ligni]